MFFHSWGVDRHLLENERFSLASTKKMAKGIIAHFKM